MLYQQPKSLKQLLCTVYIVLVLCSTRMSHVGLEKWDFAGCNKVTDLPPPPFVLLILLTYNVLNMCSMILVVYWLYSIKPQTGYTQVSEPYWFPVFCSTGNSPHPFVFKEEKYNWNFVHPDQDQSIINLLSVKWRFYCRFL